MHIPSSRITLLATHLSLAIGQGITVDVGSTLQEIDGFGMSQAFTRAAEFEAMNPEPRQKGLDYLFSTETGAGFTIIRNRIGSQSNAECILPENPGGPDAEPNYVWDGSDSSQVWFSKEAMKYGVSTIYADAWSAPGFMKTNGDEANGGYLCGVEGKSCQSGDWREMYADYLTQYVKFYAQEGIPVTHLGFLNEPDYVTQYSSMQSDGNQAASFIPILHDSLSTAGLTNVSITCCDAMGWPSAREITARLVAKDMEEHLGIITSHTYTGEPDTPLDTQLKTWETEACDLDSEWCTTWYSNGGPCEGMTWASKLHNGIVNAGLSAYLYWEGVEVNQFQASSYLVASDGTEVIPSGRLWAFAMWSRFIRPGAKRVETSGEVGGVGVGAFVNGDGSVVVVLTNEGDAADVDVAFSGFVPGGAQGYLTDNEHEVAETEVTVGEGGVSVSVPSRAVVTVRLTAEGAAE
ncbi:hypothetical protein FQN53_001960 [Emmonsiellopsis sp. PD_33]|nr:hypothetical protein FQN53_001960 [Emmonsiellopsis sp. PD_33]